MYDKPSGDELEWWNMAQLAKWANVPVWDLIEQPKAMIFRLGEVMSIEQEVREAQLERSKS